MLTTQLYLVSRMRKSGGILPRLHMQSWRARGYLYKRAIKRNEKKINSEGALQKYYLMCSTQRGKRRNSHTNLFLKIRIKKRNNKMKSVGLDNHNKYKA